MGDAKRKPPAAEGNSAGNHITDFAHALGSKKGLDLIPPDQYQTYMDPRYPPETRVWAWLLGHTIARASRSPYAVDAKAQPLTLKHAAAHLDMDPGNVHRAWKDLETEGRVYRKDGRLYLRGDFKLAKLKPKIVSTDNYSAYIQKDLAKLTPEKRGEFLTLWDTNEKLWLRSFAAAKTTLRFLIDERQNSIAAQFGVKLRREEKGTSEKRAELQARVTTLRPVLELLVRTIEDGCQYEPEVNLVLTSEKAVQTRGLLETTELTGPLSKTEYYSEKGRSVSKSVGGNGTDRPTGTEAANTQPQEVRELLTRLLGDELHDSPSDRLCVQVVVELRGAPLQDLEQRIRLRHRQIKSYGIICDIRKGAGFGAGLARDVGEQWARATEAAVKGRASHQAEQERQRRIRIRDLQELWPTLLPDDRAWYAREWPERLAEAGIEVAGGAS